MEKTIEERRLEFLEDTVKYYSEDVSRRALTKEGSCKYKTEDGKKCAIGRFIIENKYNPNMDINSNMSAITLISEYEGCLPIEIIKLGGTFLCSIQTLHDNKDFWDGVGLTPKGIEYISIIKNNILSNIYF